MHVHLQKLQVKFVRQGHRVKVKVTGAKKRVCESYRRVVCLRLKGNLVAFCLLSLCSLPVFPYTVGHVA